MSAPNQPIDPEALLANAGLLRALAMSLLADEHSAEDVVQETWLAALEHPSSPRQSLRSWLAGVSHHLALQVIRRKQRRLRRERAAARPEARPSAADVAEGLETLRVAVEAAQELKEPYRAVVFLRYFHELSLDAIALTLEVPLETVRTRLRRALEQLRVRLDREHGGDRKRWRVALLPFADPLAEVAAGGAAGSLGTVLLGAIAMTLKTKIVLAAALVLAAAGTVYVGVAGLSEPGTATTSEPAANARAAPADTRREPGPARPEPTDPQRKTMQASDLAAGSAVVHGRCVAAETGIALGGCAVQLWGSAGNQEDPVPEPRARAWKNPPSATTGPDGTFRLVVVPPTGFQFHIGLTSAGRCAVHADNGFALASGQDLDLGDVPLTRGTRVTGRVVEPDGSPVARATVYLQRQEPAPPGFLKPILYCGADGRVDGSFEFSDSILPGTWTVSQVTGRDRDLLEPKTLVIEDGQLTAELRVVLETVDPKDLLTGTVVDETGAPVRALGLMALSDLRGFAGNGSTERDGAFEIRRKVSEDDRVHIAASHNAGYDDFRSEATYAWGTSGIKLTARRSGSAEVLVVEAETGKPVEEYAFRYFPDDGGSRSSSDDHLRFEHRESGRASVKDVKLGKGVLIVFPKDQALLACGPIRFERAEGQTPTVRVELRQSVELRVHLVRKDGSPVAGSRLELIRPDPREKVVTLRSFSSSLEDAWVHRSSSGAMAIVLAEATTGADGFAVVKGPPSRGELAIRALGPGHMPFVEQRVGLARGRPELNLVAPAGATLKGHVKPVALLQTYAPPGGIRKSASAGDDKAKESLAAKSPGLVLTDSIVRFPHAPAERIPLGDDGSFRIEGIPAGNWNLEFHFTTWNHDGAPTGDRSGLLQKIADLREDETRELELDLGPALPARIKGRVFLDGELFRNGSVCLSYVRTDSAFSGPTGWGALTDEHGCFTLEAPAGVYVLDAWVGKLQHNAIHGRDQIRIEAGAETEHVFRLDRSKAVVKIVESDGTTPVSGRKFTAFEERYQWYLELTTGTDGVLVVDPAWTGPFKLFTYPLELDEDAQAKLQRENTDELFKRRIVLGPVAVPEGEKEARFELRMPPPKK